jgi:hypothetical protein
MPLWGNTDRANDAAKFICAQFNMPHVHNDTFHRFYLWGEAGKPSANIPGMETANVANLSLLNYSKSIVGLYGVSPAELHAAAPNRGKPAHTGWVIKTQGTGGRADRVTYETIVAMGSITNDGADDVSFPDYRIVIDTQPEDRIDIFTPNVTLEVVAHSIEDGAPLFYQWKIWDEANVKWTSVKDTPETAPGVPPAQWTFKGNNTPILIANTQYANSNIYHCLVSTYGSNAVTSKVVQICNIGQDERDALNYDAEEVDLVYAWFQKYMPNNIIR